MDGLRVAIVHEWLTTYGGSEQVAQRLATALDATDVFTFTARPELAEALFPGRRVHVTWLGDRGSAREHWQRFLPVMPRAWRSLDLRGFDVVVTSSHACANAIRVPRGTLHVSYVHSPMRYAWRWREELERVPAALRPVWPIAAAAFRSDDRRFAREVDVFVANSAHVAAHVREAYGAASAGPVAEGTVGGGTGTEVPARREGFLVAGRLVAYKRVATAIEAARIAGIPLVVAGDGPQLPTLRRLAAGADVRFIVRPERAALRELYRSVRALVVPGIEDFGMTMVEAQACGTPVLALGAGGALEATADGRTGSLYADPSPASLARAMTAFDGEAFDRHDVRAFAERFDAMRFDEEIARIVGEAAGRLARGGNGQSPVSRSRLADALT